MEIKIGMLTLIGTAENGNINITACRTDGDLGKLIAKLIGINTISNDATDRPVDTVRATVDDMRLLPGAPPAGPNLGAVNHLGQTSIVVDPVPTTVPAGAIAEQIVHKSGEVQPPLQMQPAPVIPPPGPAVMQPTQLPPAIVQPVTSAPVAVDAPVVPGISPAVIQGFAGGTAGKVIDTPIQPPVTSTASSSLTDLRQDQQSVVQQFNVAPVASVEVPLDPNKRFDISTLPPEKQASIASTFEKANAFNVEQLRSNLPQTIGQPAETFASLTPDQVLNLIWNVLVREKTRN
jgi:hypothetical protein